MWYTKPECYALIVSVIALAVSYYAYLVAKRGTKSTIQHQLISQAIEINEAFLRHYVKGPYAFHLQIPDKRVQEFTAKAVLLLHQINLLRNVFENQDIVGKGGIFL